MMAWSGRFDDFKQFGKGDSSRNRTGNSFATGQSAKNRMYEAAQNNQTSFQSNGQNTSDSDVTKISDIYPDMPNVVSLFISRY